MKKRLLLTCLGLALICLCATSGLIVNLIATAAGDDLSNHAASVNENLPGDVSVEQVGNPGEIDWSQAWTLGQSNSDVIVAVIDTGIDSDHEDLVGRVVDEVNLNDSPVIDDLNGHGTHIAGIIAADADNGIGIDGVAPCCLLVNIKATDDSGRCDAKAIANGILWAVNKGASIINISLRLDEPSSLLEEAVAYAWGKGALIVAAAGNDGGSTPQYPAYYPECIAVTATKEDGSRAPLASYGDWVDIAALGYQVYSTLPDSEYGYKTGTSQATAYVSGLAALLYSMAIDSNGNGWVNDEVRAAIETSCLHAAGSGMGNGLVRPVEAVEALHNESSMFQQDVPLEESNEQFLSVQIDGYAD
jgi:thermitase